MVIVWMASIGLALSAYSELSEYLKRRDNSYVPLCDINKQMSCSKAFESKWGKTFNIPNSILGMAFYAFLLVIQFLFKPNVLEIANYILISSALLFSAYLGYNLYFKVKSLCPICMSIYVVNIIMFVSLFI